MAANDTIFASAMVLIAKIDRRVNLNLQFAKRGSLLILEKS
jgi:hypothetical protein